MTVAVRKDVGGDMAGADGRPTPLQVDANGNLRITGGTGGAVDTELPAAETPADGMANVAAPRVISIPMVLRVNDYVRKRGRQLAAAFSSAARTATVNSGVINIYDGMGIYVWIDVTASATVAGVVPRIQQFPYLGAVWANLNPTPPTITAVGTYGLLIYPGATTVGASPGVVQAISGVIGDQLRIRMEHGDALSITYAVSYEILP